MRRHNKRIDDLEKAMRKPNGIHSNGNHTVRIIDGLRDFDPARESCKQCEHNLSCLADKRPHESILHTSQLPCVVEEGAIVFSYHGTDYLKFQTHTKQITDYGYWGFTVTTSRSIRWYLEALFYFGHLDSQATVEELITTFKKRTLKEGEEGWVSTC
jgi:hypothetical protein